MVYNDLHGLFLSHQDTHALVLLVLQDADIADSTFLPGFVARSNIEEGLAINKKLSSL